MSHGELPSQCVSMASSDTEPQETATPCGGGGMSFAVKLSQVIPLRIVSGDGRTPIEDPFLRSQLGLVFAYIGHAQRVN